MTKPVKGISFGTLSITATARKLVNEALDSGRVSSGKLVRRFEVEFAKLHGVRQAVAVATGTDADTLALAVMYDYGAQRGDEVIVPALSFVATGNAVLQAGFTPVFVDIDRATLNIDPSRIEAAVTPRTRGIMPVHLMGKPAAMDEVMDVAGRHKLMVIEDAAEAHGALYKGRRVGTIGDMGAFSLYVAHILTTIEGGIVTTDDEEKAEILRSLRSHGRACKCETCVLNVSGGVCDKRFNNPGHTDIRFVFERFGFSSKMNELEAAIGLGSLEEYDSIITKRRANFKAMSAIVERYPDFLYTIREEPHEQFGPHALPIIVKESAPFTRDALVSHLEKKHIDSRNMFQSMPTQCAGFAYLGHRLGEFPEAEYVADYGLHIGVHQDIDEDQIAYLDETLADFIKNNT